MTCRATEYENAVRRGGSNDDEVRRKKKKKGSRSGSTPGELGELGLRARLGVEGTLQVVGTSNTARRVVRSVPPSVVLRRAGPRRARPGAPASAIRRSTFSRLIFDHVERSGAGCSAQERRLVGPALPVDPAEAQAHVDRLCAPVTVGIPDAFFAIRIHSPGLRPAWPRLEPAPRTPPGPGKPSSGRSSAIGPRLRPRATALHVDEAGDQSRAATPSPRRPPRPRVTGATIYCEARGVGARVVLVHRTGAPARCGSRVADSHPDAAAHHSGGLRGHGRSTNPDGATYSADRGRRRVADRGSRPRSPVVGDSDGVRLSSSSVLATPACGRARLLRCRACEPGRCRFWPEFLGADEQGRPDVTQVDASFGDAARVVKAHPGRVSQLAQSPVAQIVLMWLGYKGLTDR